MLAQQPCYTLLEDPRETGDCESNAEHINKYASDTQWRWDKRREIAVVFCEIVPLSIYMPVYAWRKHFFCLCHLSISWVTSSFWEVGCFFYIPCMFLLRIALLESRLSVWLLGWNAQACKRAVNSHLELRWNFKETIIHEDSLSPALFPKSVSVCSIRSPCADQRHVPPTVLCKQMKGLYWTVYECKFESWGDLRF